VRFCQGADIHLVRSRIQESVWNSRGRFALVNAPPMHFEIPLLSHSIADRKHSRFVVMGVNYSLALVADGTVVACERVGIANALCPMGLTA